MNNKLELLTQSEINIIAHLDDFVDGDKCIIISGQLAEKSGSTRAGVVMVLRILSFLDIITSRSAGTKGTFVQVLDREKFDRWVAYCKNNMV